MLVSRFSLTSVTNVGIHEDAFVEHCRGFVQVNFVTEKAALAAQPDAWLLSQ